LKKKLIHNERFSEYKYIFYKGDCVINTAFENKYGSDGNVIYVFCLIENPSEYKCTANSHCEVIPFPMFGITMVTRARQNKQ